jgi:ketosteroid isomerase-like protein
MKRSRFASPQDAEAAFYEALERADLDAMMDLWADDEEIICVHPAGPRLAGTEQVRASWREIFRNGPTLRFQLSDREVHHSATLAVSCVHENIQVSGQEQDVHVVTATNVYVLTPDGWRMLVHHASPSTRAPEPPEREEPPVLH